MRNTKVSFRPSGGLHFLEREGAHLEKERGALLKTEGARLGREGPLGRRERVWGWRVG